MHEDNCNCISPEKDIPSLVQLCLKTEQDSGLAENSLKELKRYLLSIIAMPFVKSLGVYAIYMTHAPRNIRIRCLHKDMIVVCH